MIQEQAQRSSYCLAISVLLLILVSALLYALVQFGANFGGSGYSFEQEEAYRLAQETQNWRRYHPTKSNYGFASITIFYQDGSSRRFVRETHGIAFPFESDPVRKIHSEEFAHDWILDELDILKNARYIDAQTTSITVIIFSQVSVCVPCQRKMRSWQREFRQVAGTQMLTLSIWNLTHGYDPGDHPKGFPVASPDDVIEVPIRFQ